MRDGLLGFAIGLGFALLVQSCHARAATLAAAFPPEADTRWVCLLVDGEPQSCIEAAEASSCALWDVPVALGSSYHAIAIDANGNDSAPSNVYGGRDLLDCTRCRRELAGVP